MNLRLAVLLLGGILTLSSCHHEENALPAAKEAEHENENTEPVVAVVHPVLEDLSRSVSLTAEFKPYQEIEVHARVTGYVREMKVDVGGPRQDRRGDRDPGNSRNPWAASSDA